MLPTEPEPPVQTGAKQENWLSTDEARAYLGTRLNKGKSVSYDTLRRNVVAGRLHPRKKGIGKTMFYDPKELDTLVQLEPNASLGHN